MSSAVLHIKETAKKKRGQLISTSTIGSGCSSSGGGGGQMAASKQLSGIRNSARSKGQQSAQRLEHSTGEREEYESDEDEQSLNHFLLTYDSDGESEPDVSDDKRGGEQTEMEPGEYTTRRNSRSSDDLTIGRSPTITTKTTSRRQRQRSANASRKFHRGIMFFDCQACGSTKNTNASCICFSMTCTRNW